MAFIADLLTTAEDAVRRRSRGSRRRGAGSPGSAPRSFAGMRLVTAEEVAAATSVAEAVEALAAALRDGLDPERDAERLRVETTTGQLLLMPSAREHSSGVKVLSSTPDNDRRGLSTLQGVFVLFDGPGQRPVALLDGPALTLLRTPAVSALAVRLLTPAHARGPARLAVLGTGHQARAHVAAVRAVRDVGEVVLVGRRPEPLEAMAREVADASLSVSTVPMERAGEAVAGADVVCCCTASATPLFDGSVVSDDAVVVAMGSHTPDTRELDAQLMGRAGTVLVESRASALREAGGILQAVDEGALDVDRLVTLRDLVTGDATVAPGGPRVFTGTGMPWQDLVVGAHVHRGLGG